MDWFKRYGIPGAYFLVLVLAWFYAGYKCWPMNLRLEDLVKLGAFQFLPAGYVLSVLGQLCYLRRSNWKGLHSRAAERMGVTFIGEKCSNEFCEAELEALSMLNAGVNNKDNDPSGKNISVDSHQFIQEWIRKRMDVVVINRTMEIATVAAPIAAAIVGWTFAGIRYQWSGKLILCLALTSGLILWIVRRCRQTLEKQIVVVISGEFQASVQKASKYNKVILGKDRGYADPRRLCWVLCSPGRFLDWMGGLITEKLKFTKKKDDTKEGKTTGAAG